MKKPRIPASVPTWVVLVAGILLNGVVIGVLMVPLTWGIYTIWPDADQGTVSAVNFLLGMALGSLGIIWWLHWAFKREEAQW